MANKSTNTVKGHDHQFVDSPPDELLCLSCTLVARDPQQTSCCGKVYCKACIDGLSEKSSQCPRCKKFFKCFPDEETDEIIKDLKAKCDSSTNGCEWEGTLRDLEEHSKACDYSLRPCPYKCSDSDGIFITQVLRKDIVKHGSEECPRRWYTCPHCSKEGEYEHITTLHLQECPEAPAPCPNKGCKELVPRSQIRNHRVTKCEFELVRCKYYESIGCEATPCRKDVQEHESDDGQHLRLAIKAIDTTKSRTSNIEFSVRQLKHLMFTFVHRQEAEERFNDIDTAMEKTSRKHENTLEYIRNLHSIMHAQMQSREIDQLKSAAIDSTSTDGESELFKALPNVMKFTNFSKRKSHNKIICSPPFYSSPGGYKMCLSVCPNGNDKGKDSHVSVYVNILRGEYDKHLEWPLTTGTVVIELLNQLSDEGHHRVEIHFVNGAPDKGTGYAKFIPHTDLRYRCMSDHPPKQYLKDDCLYFRYEVRCTTPKPWLSATNVF